MEVNDLLYRKRSLMRCNCDSNNRKVFEVMVRFRRG